jgi:hypothetical protein
MSTRSQHRSHMSVAEAKGVNWPSRAVFDLLLLINCNLQGAVCGNGERREIKAGLVYWG